MIFTHIKNLIKTDSEVMKNQVKSYSHLILETEGEIKGMEKILTYIKELEDKEEKITEEAESIINTISNSYADRIFESEDVKNVICEAINEEKALKFLSLEILKKICKKLKIEVVAV